MRQSASQVKATLAGSLRSALTWPALRLLRLRQRAKAESAQISLDTDRLLMEAATNGSGQLWELFSNLFQLVGELQFARLH
jgi:hypothetical protein